jgi:hypothetical protein
LRLQIVGDRPREMFVFQNLTVFVQTFMRGGP